MFIQNRPSGWDNLKKISILYENMQSCKAEDYFTDVISPPPIRKVLRSNFIYSKSYSYYKNLLSILFDTFQTVSNRETEVQTEDEQIFLGRQQQLLMQGQTQTRGESPMRTPQPTSGKTVPRTSVSKSFHCKSIDLVFCSLFLVCSRWMVN